MTRDELAEALDGPRRPVGRFVMVHRDRTTATACRVLAEGVRRAGPLVACTTRLSSPHAANPAWRARLATAARQDVWRRMRRARGLAPAVVVRSIEGGAEVTLAPAFLDGAAAAPGTLDALAQIFHDDARRWTAWADRAVST